MELFILRHGEAGKKLSSTIGDHARPLTSIGKEEVLEEAKALKRIGVKFDLIISSPLKRAYETASIVAGVYKAKKKLKVWNELAPEGSKKDVYNKISQLKEEQFVLLVGHEPQLGEITKEIIHKGKTTSCNLLLKKGGLLRINILTRSPVPKGELRWLLTPRILKTVTKKSS
jgi:phosphohistidine phosphatase